MSQCNLYHSQKISRKSASNYNSILVFSELKLEDELAIGLKKVHFTFILDFLILDNERMSFGVDLSEKLKDPDFIQDCIDFNETKK